MPYQSVSLSSGQVATLQSLRTAQNYSAGYSYVAGIVRDTSGSDPHLADWFDAAAHINANDGSFVSDYVHDAATLSALAGGMILTSQEFQTASDALANGVLGNVVTSGQVGDLNAIISSDVRTVVESMGLVPEAWPGAVMALLPSPIGLELDPTSPFYVDLYKSFRDRGVDNFFEILGRWILTFGIEAEAANLAALSMMFEFLSHPYLLPELIRDRFNEALAWRLPRDPLVLDLDGDGIETVGADPNDPVLFDHRGIGVRTGTGWIASDDGFLVRDVDSDGTIDDGTELFGDSTFLQSGARAANGFAALADLDSNTDGVINSSDAAFSELMVWRDLNQDGLSQSGELTSLSSAGITSISLSTTPNSEELENGNTIGDLGTFTRTVGGSGTLAAADLADLELDEDTFHREFTTAIPLEEGVTDLPSVGGSGAVRDLWEAASQSEDVFDALTLAAAATSRASQLEAVDDLLTAWAETSGLQTMDERESANLHFTWTHIGDLSLPYFGGGPPTGPEQIAEWNTWIATLDETKRRLTVLEAFNGRMFFALPEDDFQGAASGLGSGSAGGGSSGGVAVTSISIEISLLPGQMDLLNRSYDALSGSVYGAIAAQTRLAPYLDAVEVGFGTDGVEFDVSGIDTLVDTQLATDAVVGIGDIVDLIRHVRALQGLGWDGVASLRGAIENYGTATGVDTFLSNENVLEVTGTFSGTIESEIVVGGSGGDTFNGGAGDDMLSGGTGADDLFGGLDDDTLDGGAGDDVLQGSDGSDTYLFGIGDGQDQIINNDVTEGRVDTLQLKAGIQTTDVSLSRNATDLVVMLAGTTDQVQVSSFFYQDGDGGYALDALRFSNGIVWDLATVKALVLEGSTANDYLYAYSEGSTISGADGSDVITGAAGVDTLNGDAGDDQIYAGDGADVLNGGADADMLYGEAGNDVLSGDGGADYLYGGFGDDTLDGGAGDDNLEGTDGSDTYLFGVSDGQDYIVNYDLGVGRLDTLQLKAGIGESDVVLSRDSTSLIVKLVGTSDQVSVSSFFYLDGTAGYALDRIRLDNGTVWNFATIKTMVQQGTSGNDSLYAYAAGDTLSGLAGSDMIVGAAGVDTLNGGDGDDQIWGGDSADTLNGGADGDMLAGENGNDIINGDAGNDILDGGYGNDTLDGGTGDDTMYGQNDNDTYIVDSATDIIYESASMGTDLILSSVSYTVSANVENLTLTGSAAINATGNTLNNTLTGNSGNNVLDGGTGTDTLVGGLGDDTYVVNSSGDVVTESASQGTDLVQSSIAYTLGSNVENLTLTGSSGINGTGNTLDNVLTGNSGSNTLTGLGGNDTLSAGSAGTDVLVGGIGDDIYVIARTSGITVTENSSEGTDTVQASVAYSLGNNVENLTLTGSSNITGTGNSLANVITGNSGNNTLDGGAGNDTLLGGAGNDIYTVDSSSDVVTENTSEGTDLVNASATFTLGSNVENLTLTGTSAINGTGNTLDNILTGNSGNNTLTGSDGNDTLDPGSAGTDTLQGGVGNDTYVIARSSGITVTENSGEGTDLVQASVTVTLGSNVENLTLTGSSAIDGTGNTLDNVLTGNSGNNTLTGSGGNDTLNGGGGTDTMLGGAGDDVYTVDVTGDVTTENASEGTDLINSAVTRTLGSNIEMLFLTGSSAINATGNSVANLLRGNTGVNTLAGGGDTDILEGGGGNDTLSNSSGNTLLNGGAGTDTLTGTSSNDLLIGGLGNDALTTGSGADLIVFNLGDGSDTVAASTTKDNVLSVGGGAVYADLLFQKSGNNLILKVGGSDQITFTSFYSSSSNHSVNKLQVVIEVTTDYDSGSGDATRNKKVETFDFEGLITAFDAARVANPSLTTWALTNALTAQHLSGSDTAALGGDLAYRYNRFNGLSDISFTPAAAILAASGFGTSAQTLLTTGSLQDSSPRLS
ncbi:MAG: calcium-binding protein [Pseudomonadota bacterium]